MSADNNHFMNREIRALQQEEPRPDAKAETILVLLKEKRETKMSVLRKVSVPTLVSIAAIAGVFFVAQPKVVAATPERVIKAIQDIKNYTINSFVVTNGERHLQSKTTVHDKERKTVYYDASGKEVDAPSGQAFMMMHDSPMGMGMKMDGGGNLIWMSKDDINDMKSKFDMKIEEGRAPKGSVRVEITKGPDGNEVKHYFIDGKEVDKLPADVQAKVDSMKPGEGGNVRVEVRKGADGKEDKHVFVDGKEVHGKSVTLGGKGTVRVEVTKDASGKEVKHYYVDGKEVPKLPDDMAGHIKMLGGNGNGKVDSIVVMNDAEIREPGKSADVNVAKSMAVMSGKDGKPMIVQSGQTSADYLVNLLKDTDKWTIERGVTYKGQKLDKFTLKGPISPIVLYVDPATALPKVLQFGSPLQEDSTIEDVYEYSIQP